jgi:ketosteroid isomerase-like protein
MKSAVLLAAVLMACATPVPPAGLSETDVAAIRANGDAFEKAVNDTNWAAFADFYTATTQFMPPNGPALTSHEALIAFGRGFPPFDGFNLTPVTIDGNGDLAFVHGRYSWTIRVPGTPAVPDSGKYIEIWRKQADGTWKITHDVFNSDVPLPEPPRK